MTAPDDNVAGLPPPLPPMSLDELIAAGFRHHLADQHADAEALYRTILASPSPHALANYGLGLLCQSQGRLLEAAEAYRRAITIRGDYADALVNLGATLHALGRGDEAIVHYQRAIAVRPDFALAHCNLGKALQDKGQLEEAITVYTRAIKLAPLSITAHANLGGALLDQNRFAESAAMSLRALDLQPDLALALTNLGAAMLGLGQFDAALAVCRRAISLQPAAAMMNGTLGGVMLELGAFTEAAVACRRAIALDPALAMAHFNLAHACKAVGELAEAEAACRRAVALQGDRPEHHFLLGHLLLLQGNFAPGWVEYEWRWRLPAFAWLRDFQAEGEPVVWQGEELAGKTILLLPEQGLGDTILFVRYALLLAERGARVIIAAHWPMFRLLSLLTSVTVVPMPSKPWPEFDVYCPLLDLPRLCGTSLSSTIPKSPYLHADPVTRAAWRQRLSSDGPRVGVVWGGNPETKYDRFRSPHLAPILPWFDIAGITFVVLQAGPARHDLAATPLPSHVIDLGPELDDVATTAAIMSELDLVISSCTAPLHLAGALGVRTWAMLPFAPYFPWLLDRSDSIWYPTMQLYRQERPGTDWSALVARIGQDLTQFAASWVGSRPIVASV